MPVFKDLELDELRGQFNPTHLGYEAGQAGLPPLESKNDPHESPIVEEINRRVLAARSSHSNYLEQARREWNEIHEVDPSGDINAAEKDAEAQFSKVEQTAALELQDKRVDSERRRIDLSKFKADNDLTRLPDYPDSGRQVLMVGIVAILFVIESFANAAFLAKGNELGLVGAYTVAFGISLANLLPPFLFFGPFSRHLVHIGVGWRVIAGICTVFYFGIALTLNLGVAHYREVSGRLIGDAGVEVVRRMTDRPLNLQDAESWLLLGIGFIFSCIAFVDGRKLDDPYPEYGKLDRRMRRAREQYTDAKHDVSQELDEIREKALDEIKRIAHRAQNRPRELQRIEEECQRVLSEFDRHMAQIQHVGATLINEYREANHNARPDRGVPIAHQKGWGLMIPEVDRGGPVFPGHSSTERLQSIESNYRQATDRIHERYEAVLSRLLNSSGTERAAAPAAQGAFLPEDSSQDSLSLKTQSKA